MVTFHGLWRCRVVIQPVVINSGIWGHLAGITGHVCVAAGIGIIFTPGAHEVLQKRQSNPFSSINCFHRDSRALL